MKILLAGHSAGLEGAQRVVLDLARAMIAQPDVELLVVLPDDGPLTALLEDVPAQTVRITQRWWANRRAPIPRRAWSLGVNAGAVASLRALMARFQPDVVVTETLTIPAAAVAARLAGRPHLWHVHEFGSEDHDLHFHIGRDRTMRLVDDLSEVVAACSTAVADHLEQWVAKEKLRVLPPALDVGPRRAPGRPPTGREVRLLLAGTKVQGKGQAEALAALGILQDHDVPARLRLVGPGKRRDVSALERTAHQLRVADRVDFVEEVDDLSPELEAADIVLVCSRAEAFGRVAGEAMRKEVPVVGARAGGVAEQLLASGGGLLYEPGDVAGLTGAIERLYGDPDLWRRCGQAGARWAAQFSVERAGAAFLDVAREAMERHHRTALRGDRSGH